MLIFCAVPFLFLSIQTQNQCETVLTRLPCFYNHSSVCRLNPEDNFSVTNSSSHVLISGRFCGVFFLCCLQLIVSPTLTSPPPKKTFLFPLILIIYRLGQVIKSKGEKHHYNWNNVCQNHFCSSKSSDALG